MCEWLLDMWDSYRHIHASGGADSSSVDVTLLPGWAYARALALRAQEDNKNDSVCTSFYALKHFLMHT
jgi:hypothetical protein